MRITAANTQPRIGIFLGLHFLVGGRHDADVAGGEVEGGAREGVERAPRLHRVDHALDGRGLVIAQEQHHRHHVAVGVQQAGAGLDVARRLRELVGLARNVAPLEAAFVPAGDRDLGDDGQRHHFLHAVDVAHLPREGVDGRHELVAGAGRLLRLDDDLEDVDADRELGGDDVAVAVVARVGAQLGHARLRIADGRLAALPDAEHAQQHGDADDDDQRGCALGDAREASPVLGELRLAALRRARGTASSHFTHDTSTGSRMRSVRITMATPMLAVTAISCTTCTGISRMVMKPTRSASSAMMAGISSCRKVCRAASMLPTGRRPRLPSRR